MKKLNCWEFKKCGREPGGDKVDDFGVCSAASKTDADGINSGTNGGRICWAISGTFCRGSVQGVFASKITSCVNCDFFQLVDREEADQHGETVKFLKNQGECSSTEDDE